MCRRKAYTQAHAGASPAILVAAAFCGVRFSADTAISHRFSCLLQPGPARVWCRTPRGPKFGAILNPLPPQHETIEGHVRAASLLGLAALLAIVWIVSFVIFHVAGWLIHILLLLALIFLLLQLFTGRPTKL